MANGVQAKARRLKMAERAQQMLDLHFPGSDLWLWRRKTNDGFTTIPRTMPIVMQAIDALSKGQPAGHVLFCLWARSPDHPLVTIENPAIFASEAGFSGERAVDTWRKRMKQLRDLWFIVTKPGASGEFHYRREAGLGDAPREHVAVLHDAVRGCARRARMKRTCAVPSRISSAHRAGTLWASWTTERQRACASQRSRLWAYTCGAKNSHRPARRLRRPVRAPRRYFHHA